MQVTKTYYTIQDYRKYNRGDGRRKYDPSLDFWQWRDWANEYDYATVQEAMTELKTSQEAETGTKYRIVKHEIFAEFELT
jgi:hypothetical protein